MLTAAVALNASEWHGAWQAADSHVYGSRRTPGRQRTGFILDGPGPGRLWDHPHIRKLPGGAELRSGPSTITWKHQLVSRAPPTKTIGDASTGDYNYNTTTQQHSSTQIGSGATTSRRHRQQPEEEPRRRRQRPDAGRGAAEQQRAGGGGGEPPITDPPRAAAAAAASPPLCRGGRSSPPAGGQGRSRRRRRRGRRSSAHPPSGGSRRPQEQPSAGPSRSAHRPPVDPSSNVLESDDLHSFLKIGTPSSKENSSTQTELVQEQVQLKHAQEEGDQLGRSEVLKAHTSLGGTAMTETSRAGSLLTDQLRPDAIVEPEAQAGICETVKGNEEEGPLSSPKLHGLITESSGTDAKTKSSRVSHILTEGLLPDSPACPEEWAGICDKQ